MPISIPPAYEATGYRRLLAYNGVFFPGRLALELPAELDIVDEPETSTRPARSRLLFVGVPGGAVPLTRVVNGTSPIRINGAAFDDLATDITISILAASGANAGSMSIADFNKLAGITAGAAVATVGATAPITSTGGLNPVIGIDPAALAINRELGANTLTGTTTTRYLLTGFNTGTASANAIEMPVVKAFSIASMKLWFRVAGTAGANISYVLRKNGVAVGTAVLTVASDAAANTVYSATFTAVTYAAGDTWSVEVTKSGAIATSPTDIVLTVQQVF